jgi:hypothetical protein
MTKPIIKIHDADSDSVIEREMNAKEFADYQKTQQEAELTAQKMQETNVKKQELFDRLGITEAEAKLLLS